MPKTDPLIERMEVDVSIAERRVDAQKARVAKAETAHRFAVNDLTEEQIKLENAKIKLANAKATRQPEQEFVDPKPWHAIAAPGAIIKGPTRFSMKSMSYTNCETRYEPRTKEQYEADHFRDPAPWVDRSEGVEYRHSACLFPEHNGCTYEPRSKAEYDTEETP